jgi:hypothetical protein
MFHCVMCDVIEVEVYCAHIRTSHVEGLDVQSLVVAPLVITRLSMTEQLPETTWQIHYN